MIRKAKIHEVPEIRRFLAEFSQDGGILPRTLADLYGQLRDYYVYREDQGPSWASPPCTSAGPAWEKSGPWP